MTSVGKYAFKHCTNLKSILLPKDTKVLHEDSFANCTHLSSV
ncbi:MAG: leucine-rich repeat protein [Methanobrevibacter sp.]|nr:leucine-rich repeat protein [Methanobrevibacter sp.]